MEIYDREIDFSLDGVNLTARVNEGFDLERANLFLTKVVVTRSDTGTEITVTPTVRAQVAAALNKSVGGIFFDSEQETSKHLSKRLDEGLLAKLRSPFLDPSWREEAVQVSPTDRERTAFDRSSRWKQTSDIPGAIENRKFTQARNLLEKIQADLDPSDFTLSEIRYHFNAAAAPIRAEDGAQVVRFGMSHLRTLLEAGFIEEFESGRYSIAYEGRQ